MNLLPEMTAGLLQCRDLMGVYSGIWQAMPTHVQCHGSYGLRQFPSGAKDVLVININKGSSFPSWSFSMIVIAVVSKR